MDQQHDQGERRRRRPQPKGSSATPIIGIMLLVVGAVAVAMLIQDSKETASAAEVVQEPEHKPFSKYREEAPPARKADENPWREAPAGLANADVWIEALAIGKAADEKLAEANKARSGGDNAMYQAQGKSAKETYDKALLMTAEWEAGLIDKYGERNPQVRQIMGIRTRWFDKLRVLHKTTGR
jgi:hypothetical protein